MQTLWGTYNNAMFCRYVLICHYERYDKIYSGGQTCLLCLSVWIIMYAIQLPNHIGWGDTRFSVTFYVCTFANNVHSYATFYIVVGVVLPVSATFLAYLGIFCETCANYNFSVQTLTDLIAFRSPQHQNFKNNTMNFR